MTLPDLIGYVGVALIAGTYFLSQIGRMDATRPFYPILNALGAALILVSLYFEPNMPALVMELFWLAASLIGLVRALVAKHPSTRSR